jgi:hypothetical protein
VKTFQNRVVSEELIAFGVGGKLTPEMCEGFAGVEPPQRVRIEIEAEYETVKGKFLEDGTVKATDILTLDASTAKIVAVGVPRPGPAEIPGQEAIPIADKPSDEEPGPDEPTPLDRKRKAAGE